MAFYLKPAEPVADGIRRICSEQLGKLIAEIEQPGLDNDKTIHQIRKRCKKIRGVLRLVRDDSKTVYQSENDHFRDMARDFSVLRDVSVYPETYDKLIDRYGDHVDRRVLSPVRASLTRQRERFFRNEPLAVRLEDLRQRVEEARSRIADWPLRAGYEFDRIEGGLHKTYRRGRSAMRQACAERTAAAFHEWRKRVKYHRYHLRVLRDLWPPVIESCWGEARLLSDLLGAEHDLAELQDVLLGGEVSVGNKRSLEVCAGLAGQRRQELQASACLLGARLYAEKPKHFCRRVGNYWQAWRVESSR